MPERDAQEAALGPQRRDARTARNASKSQPDKQDMRYVLALLLIRRRVVRLEETEARRRRRAKFRCCIVRAARRPIAWSPSMPSDERTAEIQEELARLLFANAG